MVTYGRYQTALSVDSRGLRGTKEPMQFDLFDRAPDSPIVTTPRAPDLQLRPYQAEARAAVHKAHETHRGCVVVLPTGTGKSRLAGSVAWDWKLRQRPVLIVCPTITLCQQMYSDMRALGLRVSLEQADNYSPRPLPDVVVGSIDSLKGDRLGTFPSDAFGLVVVDETHRAVSPKYLQLLEHFSGAKRLGLTATPDRTDGKSLATVYDVVAYEMSMLAAIDAGWLVPLHFCTAETDWDPSQVRTVAGDADPGDVARELVRSGCLHQAANTMADLAGEARAVAFLPTVASSVAFCAEINARHPRNAGLMPYASHIDAKTPDTLREEFFAAFKDGATRVLSNVGILVEGWDAPHASVIALLNPTKSRSRIAQMIGRGTRLCAGKTSTLVIDFCPGRLKKGRLASPADALAGKMLDDAVMEQLASGGDLAQEIAKAEEKARVKAGELEAARLRADECARRRASRHRNLATHVATKKFSYGTHDHDMREVLQADAPPSHVKAGRSPEDQKRYDMGLCSLKQSHIFRKCGLNPNMSRALAAEAMGAIASNGWKAPLDIKNDKRFHAPT